MRAGPVIAPASIANLGSGFDALGVALSLYLQAEARSAAQDRFVYQGEGEVASGPDNIMHQTFRAAFQSLGISPPKVEISVYNPIPLARGMGSSAAARVAAAALADEMLGGRLGLQGIFTVASGQEGHPDNVAPAVFGGFQIALAQPLLQQTLETPKTGLVFVVAAPPQPLSTAAARAALPDEVAFADAVFNLARAALWPAALSSGNLSLLKEAARDRLHQPYRLSLMPGAEGAIASALEAGALAAFVAGAGPSVAALSDAGNLEQVQKSLLNYAGDKGRVYALSIGEGVRWKAP